MISPYAKSFLALPRRFKQILVLAVDALSCLLTVWLALCLRLDGWVVLELGHWQAIALSILLALPIFISKGLYRSIFRYSGWESMLTVVQAIVFYGVLYTTALLIVHFPNVPRTLGLLQLPLLLLSVSASRVAARYLFSGNHAKLHKRSTLPKVLIYGAGSAGRQLAAAIANSMEMSAVGFLDDDHRLHKQVLNGLPIFNPEQLPYWIEHLDVSLVLLAVPSASRQRRNEILEMTRKANVSVRTLPGLSDLFNGSVQVSDLHELDIEDLLGRDPVPPNAQLLSKNIRGKTVLVTGAGGSIGSELCRQIIKSSPDKLLLVELSEFALYSVYHDLKNLLSEQKSSQIELLPLLASVRDEVRLHEIMSAWQPHTVYHAAAYKHVPMVEHNPAEGIKNNVLGTWVAARVAAANGVSDFVLVSTDKAVRPTNIMGASKRLAEMVLQALAQTESATQFTMVRFGNVLGSSGSVVPLFRKQIKNGGPITLTHPDITRYFMTIPEAAQLVIQAGAMAHGGDVFVLDMGEPVRIIELARRMIELSGLEVFDEDTPDGDIAIKITGLRPGEKLYEELLIGDDPQPTIHPRIMKAHEDYLPWSELSVHLHELIAALAVNDVPLIINQLKSLVPGYQPADKMVDWVLLSREDKEAEVVPELI